MRELLRAVAGPVICAVVVTGLLAAWAGTGGGGTLTRVRLQVTQAAVPMRAFTPQAAADGARRDHVPDHHEPQRHPGRARRRAQPPGQKRRAAAARPGPRARRPLVIPAHGTLTLTPIGDDLVLQQPSPYESRATVPLTLTFRHSGTITIDASVTGPGTP